MAIDMNTSEAFNQGSVIEPLQALLSLQRNAVLRAGLPSAEVRIDRIDRIKNIYIRY